MAKKWSARKMKTLAKKIRDLAAFAWFCVKLLLVIE